MNGFTTTLRVQFALIFVAIWAFGGVSGYEPQPYTPLPNSPAEQARKQSALDTLRASWSGENYTPSSVATILSAIRGGDSSTAPAQFNPDGSWHQALPSGRTFSSTQYDLNRDYFADLLALAYLYRFVETDPQARSALKTTIYDSLSLYFDNGHAAPPQYHETFNYHAPHATIGGLMLILGHVLYADLHADRASDPEVDRLFQHMREYGRQFIQAAPQIRGPNWSFRLDNCLLYVLFTNDPADMDEYAYHWNKALSFNRWEAETDGVHPDWSMMHHGDMNYWGMYGISWTGRVIEFGELFADTPWAYESEQLDFIANCMIEGTRWVLFRGVCEYTSAPKRGTMLLKRTDSVAESFQELYGRLVALGGNLLSRKSELIDLEAEAFLPPWTSAGAAQAGQPEFTGHRYFWTTEYQVHRRPTYGIYVRRCSQRTRPPEDSSVSASKMHLNYGTGYTPILRRGDEMRFSRLCWDFQHVPGTTVEQGKTVASGKAGSTKRGRNLFSGGVADGPFGFGAFNLQMIQFDTDNSGSYEFINGAAALKSTFFFDEGMVALGQSVRRIATVDGSQNNILTTINNVRRRTDVVFSVDDSPAATVSPGTPLEQRFRVSDQAWFWHDGMGYVVWPSTAPATDLVVSLGDRPFHPILQTDSDFEDRVKAELGNAAWNAGVFDMFRLWIDHGVNPAEDTYAYAVLPDCSVEALQAYAASPPVHVVANTHGIQAVAQPALGIYYASFARAGTVDFGQGKTVAADRPLMVMARRRGTAYTFSASNPIHRGLRRPYVPGTDATIGTVYAGPVDVDVTGFGVGNRVQFVLPSDRGTEGATVRGKADAASWLGVFADWEFDHAGAGGVDSGLSATDWNTSTPDTATPGWTVTRLGADPASSLVVHPSNGRLVLTGKSDGVTGTSEAVLAFGADHHQGSISADLGLNSGSTWTAAKFNLVNISGGTTNVLVDCTIQRNGTNAYNLISTATTNIPISGQWEDVLNRIRIDWNEGFADIELSGLDTGDIQVPGCTFLVDRNPNALLIRAGSDGDTKLRQLEVDALTVLLPLPGYVDWLDAFDLSGSPNADPDHDGDGDGYDNRSEFIAGTDPTHSSAFPAIRKVFLRPAGSQVVVEWDSVEGRHYEVYASDSLTGAYTRIEGGIEDPAGSHTSSPSQTEPSRFYRMDTRLAPQW